MTTPEARYARWRTTATIVWTAIGVLVLLGAALWAFGRIAAAFTPFVIAFVLVFLLNVPVRALDRRGMSRGLAAVLCLAVGMLLFAGVITFLVPTVTRQVVTFSENIHVYVASAERMIEAQQARLSNIAVPAWLTDVLASSSSQLSQAAVRLGNSLAGSIVDAGGGLANGALSFLLALVIAFWALKDLPKIREEIGLLAGPKYGPDVDHLMATVTRVVGGYLKGQTIASLCTGLIAGIGFSVLRIDYAIVLGILTFFLNYIPYVGPFIAGFVAALVALITVGPLAAVLAIVVVVVAQSVTDNIITPRIMSEQVDLHPTLVIFSLLVGGTLFGIVGMLFAIPVAATMKGLFVYYYEQRTDRQITTEDGALFRTLVCADEEADSDCAPDGDATSPQTDDEHPKEPAE